MKRNLGGKKILHKRYQNLQTENGPHFPVYRFPICSITIYGKKYSPPSSMFSAQWGPFTTHNTQQQQGVLIHVLQASSDFILQQVVHKYEDTKTV